MDAPAALPAPPPPERPLRKRLGRILVALGLLLAKFGKAALLLLKGGKFLTTFASMFVSIAAYSLLWGWKFAFGFVLLILVHEMGHVWQLRREGIPATAPLFIPFMGAVVGMKQLPDDAAAEARVGLAGPILGTLGTLVPLVIWLATGEDFWRALAFIGFFLNLFNLLPVLPLDGGRAMTALTPWMWLVGYVLLLGATIFFFSPIMLLIALFGGFETWHRFRHRNAPENQRFFNVRPRTRVVIAVTYLGLALALGVGTNLTHLPKSLPR